jgi:DNA polymerase III delta prime subunit
MNFTDIWVEKYRPSTLDDIVLSKDARDYFNNVKQSGNLPNLLLVGSPGVGKTTLAKIIINDILQSQYLYINASDENGIDTIRTKVINFAQTQSIFGTIKVIVLDECDGLSLDAQKALRNSMEEYHDIARFVLTANYQHKIIPALQSRCHTFVFTPPKEEYIKRVLHIIKEEEVDIEHNHLSELINKSYPDLRKCINNIQKYNITGKKGSVLSNAESIVVECLALLQKKDMYKARKHIIENETLFSNDYDMLFKTLFEQLYNNKLSLSADKNRDCMITVSEYFYRNNIVIDKEINFFTCLIEISRHIF